MNEAAALAIPLVTAYTFLVENAKLAANQKILIQGAAGAVGGVMVQMAKALGAMLLLQHQEKVLTWLKAMVLMK